MRVVNQLDRKVWQQFVDHNPQSNIFHTPEMFRVFTQTDNYQAGLWATIGHDGDILALFSPVQITVLGGLLRHVTTRAVAYGGILCASGTDGQAGLAMLLDAYKQAVRGNVLFTELRNLADVTPWQPVLTARSYMYEAHLNFLIDLTRSPADIWNSIRANARRNIRKAQRDGVIIEEVEGLECLPEAYELLTAVYKRIQVPLPAFSLFRSVYEILHPAGMARILIAKVNGVAIGAMTLLIHNGTMLYWYTGILKEYASYRAGDLLVWHALELGMRSGCHTFDFGGGGRPDQEYGVRDFKAKFGGELVNYGRNVCVHAPLRLRLSQTGYRVLRRFL
jgi:serine/alanine adding enzyme